VLEPTATAQFIADYDDYTHAHDYRNSVSDSDSEYASDFVSDYGCAGNSNAHR
jgi:hypothetical protein